MIPVIIIGHGNFAQSILESAEMILGRQENIQCINFMENESVENLDYKIENAIRFFNNHSEIIILADLFGGTPFNRSMIKATEMPNIKVIAGINLSLLIELLNIRSNNKDLDSIIEDIINTSKEMIVFGNKVLNNS